MLKKPCQNCPFLKEGPAVRLHPARVKEVWRSTMHDGPSFSCHKTVDHDNPRSSSESECVGAMMSGIKSGKGPNQLARICLRLGRFTEEQVNAILPTVFASEKEMLKTAIRRDE